MAWETRDFGGYLQSREFGTDENGRKWNNGWRFYVSGFETFGHKDLCTVLKFDRTYDYVNIDSKDRILINGKRYGRRHWDH